MTSVKHLNGEKCPLCVQGNSFTQWITNRRSQSEELMCALVTNNTN